MQGYPDDGGATDAPDASAAATAILADAIFPEPQPAQSPVVPPSQPDSGTNAKQPKHGVQVGASRRPESGERDRVMERPNLRALPPR